MPSATPESVPPAASARRSLRGRRRRLLFIALAVLAALAFGAYEIYMRVTHVSEYDARVTADIVTVSSRAEGWVTELPALEGTAVDAGQVIVRIDDRVAKLRVEALQSQINSVQADRQRLLAERRMVENQATAKTRTRTSGVRATEAAQAGVTRLVSTQRKLDAERLQAEGNLGEAVAERDRLDVIDRQIAALGPVEANLQAQVRQQQIDTGDRTIKSPVPAVIDRVIVEPGEYVLAGQRILMLHNPKEVWVEANIKETQLRKLKPGQPVHVAVDAYPDDIFTGRVTRIGSATTSRFALLPTPNPSGNFTKITQRVPVKIDFTRMPRTLSPGMMVEIDIDVR